MTSPTSAKKKGKSLDELIVQDFVYNDRRASVERPHGIRHQPLNPQTVRSGWLPEERQLQRPVNGQSTKKRIEEAGAIILDYVYRGKDTEHIASPPVTSAANEI